MPTSRVDALFFGKRARFADHRGRPARLLGAAPVRAGGDPEIAAAVREARAAVRRRLDGSDWGCLGIAAAYAGLGALVVVRNWARAGVSGVDLVQTVGLLAAVLIVPMVIIWSAARVRGSTRIAAELLTAGYCPQCGYGIRGVRPERDGCSVCPECSAAWRIAGAR